MGYDIAQMRSTTVRQTVVSVGIASGAFLAADGTRVGLILTPMNAQRYTVSSLATAVLDQGITIQAAGTSLVLHGSDVYPLLTGAMTAIVSGLGSISVGVIEILRG